MLLLIGNLDFTELLVIFVGALLIFGRRLPEVAMQVATQLVKLRRAVSQMWREAGIEEELRRVQREVASDTPKLRSPRAMLRDATREARESVAQLGSEIDPRKPLSPKPPPASAPDPAPESQVEAAEAGPERDPDRASDSAPGAPPAPRPESASTARDPGSLERAAGQAPGRAPGPDSSDPTDSESGSSR